jgi:hypothetical protein
MKPRAACRAGRADMAKSAPSRPLRSAAHRACSRVAKVCWRPSLRRVDTWMPPMSSSLPRCRRTDKRSSRALLTAPFLLLHLCAARACSLCHHVEPSPPFLSQSAACVAFMQCTTIKGGHPLRLIHTSAVSASGKPSPPHSPLFSTTSSVPSHLAPPLSSYTGPKASAEPRAAPQPEGQAPSPPLSSGAVDRAGEFCPSVTRLPRCKLGLSIMSGECTVGWQSLRYTSCRGLAPGEPPRAVLRHALEAKRTLRADAGCVLRLASAMWAALMRTSILRVQSFLPLIYLTPSHDHERNN